MPFHRGVTLISPFDGTTLGLWIELSTDPPGTWTGGPQSDWPAIAVGTDTPASYGTKVSNWIGQLCHKIVASTATQVILVTVRFTSLSPLTLDPQNGVIISEGDCKLFTVNKALVGRAMGVLGLTYSGVS